MDQFLTSFYGYLKNQLRYSENTIKSYCSDLSSFANYLQEQQINDPAKITKDDILNYLYIQAEKNNLSAISINRKLSAMRHFFKYLKEDHKIQNDSVFLIRNNKQKSENPKSINRDKLFQILDYLQQEAAKSWEKQQEYAIFLLIYAMGLRISEALSLKISDFYNDDIIIKGKGNKQRLVPVLTEAKEEVIKAFEQRKDKSHDKNSYAFLAIRGEGALNPRYVQRFIEKIRKMFCLDDSFTPHSLRHCFATHLLQNGVNINELKTLLGHSNISTTQRYLHVDLEKIISEHKEHHPLEK